MLWFASSICGGQHSNSYKKIGDEMVCLLNAELDGDDRKKLCPRVSTRSVLII